MLHARVKLVYFINILINSLFLSSCTIEKNLLFETTNSPVVETNTGSVRGSVLESRLGKLFFAFRGIRYAKPPIGNLRFKAPENIEPWSEIFDATKDGPRCPQPTDANEASDVSEDCLRLNIYTSELPKTIRPIKKPVIFYIHPGGFYAVSGQSKNYAGPQNLMDRNIVLVTINYRLGVLGFLSTNSSDAPGNAGLKDQVMALKWIKSNIIKFGGDPRIITILGYSAGAFSTTLHLVSPMSRGLFHRAIIMSGSSILPKKTQSDQIELAKRQARVVNCPETPLNAMMACLQVVPAQLLGNSVSNMFDFINNPIWLWQPVVEPNFGQERFLTHEPVELFQAGKFMKIPIMSGITKDEFAGPALYILKNETLSQLMENEWEKLAPICFHYEQGTQNSKFISQALKEKYIGGSLKGLDSLKKLNELFSDSVIIFPVYRFIHLASKYTRVYNYKFVYKGRYSHLYYPNNSPYGVVHHDDLLYLFVAPKVAPMFTELDPENIMVERMTRIISNFALYGDPNNPLDPILKDIKWRQNNIKLKKTSYLEINVNMSMKENDFNSNYKIWEDLFPLKQLTLQDILFLNSPPVSPISLPNKKH